MEPTYVFVRGQGWIPEIAQFKDVFWEFRVNGRYVRKMVRIFDRPARPGEYSRFKRRGIGYDIDGKADLNEWLYLDSTEYWDLVEDPLEIAEDYVYCAMVIL